MDPYKTYILANNERFLDELFGLIRIPSISSDSRHKEDMVSAAAYLTNQLLKSGADHADIYRLASMAAMSAAMMSMR